MILGPAVLVIVVGAPWFLRILGTDYASHGTRLLQLLALALPFMGINVLYVTYARLARRVRRVFMVQVSIAVMVLALCYVLIGTRLGITGAGIAYLSGQGVMAMILFPSVLRQYRHPEMAPDYAPGAPLVARSSGAITGSGASRLPAREARESVPPVVPEPTSTNANGTHEVPSVWRRRTAPPAARPRDDRPDNGAPGRAPSRDAEP